MNHTNSKLKGEGLLKAGEFIEKFTEKEKYLQYFCVFRIFFTLKLIKLPAACLIPNVFQYFFWCGKIFSLCDIYAKIHLKLIHLIDFHSGAVESRIR